MGNIAFNDYVKSFPHAIFGNLTIIKSKHEVDKYWFVGKEIQEILGFKDISDAISKADLDSDEVLILEKKNNPDLFNDFIRHFQKVSRLKQETSESPTISKFAPTITFISESGLYGLTMNSRKPVAKSFKRWLRKEAAPAIRKLFEIKNNVELIHSLEMHLSIDFQKEYSKWFNHTTHNEGGQNFTVASNIMMSIMHTKKPPVYWKNLGKKVAEEKGIPPSRIQSGLDGMRLVQPESSCCISLNKNLLQIGMDAKRSFELSSCDESKNFYKKMVDSGIMLYELYYSEKKSLNERQHSGSFLLPPDGGGE
jgi:prophage antirepressor-like protein